MSETSVNIYPAINTKREILSKMDSREKRILLSFYLTFNAFEATFFNRHSKTTKKIQRNGTYEEVVVYKNNFDRFNEINNFCIENNFDFFKSYSEKKEEFNFSKFHTHFKSIYCEDEHETFRGYSFLSAIKKEYRKDMKEFLHSDFNDLSENNSKDYAIMQALSLCYIFRNNLFHGTKGIEEIYNNKYTEDFSYIDKFLTELMYFLSEKNSDSY